MASVGAGGGSVLSAGASAASGTGPSPTNTFVTRGSPSNSSSDSVSSLMPPTPTAATYQATMGTAAPIGPTAMGTAASTGPVASITNGQINPNDPTNAASQLDSITNANSPYIQLAKQQGLLSAASRGLENSSIGAGAAEASAVQAAAPLAEENAQSATGAALQNSQLQTQASEFNAGEQNQNQQLEAQLATQTSQFNAAAKTQADATNSATVNAINSQMTQIQGQLAQQKLSGDQAQVLAGIQGQYSQLIASSQTAGALVQSTMTAIGNLFNNKDIDQGRINTATNQLLTQLKTSLGIISQINGGPVGTNPTVTIPGVANTNLPPQGGYRPPR